MKKVLTLAALLLLTLALLMACRVHNGSAPPDTQVEVPPPESESEAPEEFDADAWYIDRWWSLKASVEQREEAGAVFGVPGMYMDFSFSINMTRALDDMYDPELKDLSVKGGYLLEMDSTITFDSDEAADLIASEMLGGSISGLGLGITVELSGHYDNIGYFDDDGNFIFIDQSYVQAVGKDWRSVIKDKNGKRVQPLVGSYMVFEALTMEYAGTEYHAVPMYSGFTSLENTDMYLFLLIEPDLPGIDLTDRHVKVYITFPDWTSQEVWLEGEGTLVFNESLSPKE